MITWTRIVSPALAILLAGAGMLGLFLGGCQRGPGDAEEGSSIEMTATITETKTPPEAAAPQETETATFALG